MASHNPNDRTPLYPQVNQSDLEPCLLNHNPSSSSLYPEIDMKDLVENLFPDKYEIPRNNPPSSAPPPPVEDIILTIPGAILHLIDQHYSVELACGDFSIVRILQGDRIVALIARLADEIQWPLAKDQAVVKLDVAHYFFSFKAPNEAGSDSSDDDDEEDKRQKGSSSSSSSANDWLSYGLTIAPKGQERLLKELDEILDRYSNLSVQKKGKDVEMLERSVVSEMSPADMKSDNEKREKMEDQSTAFWTTLAPNVEDYNGSAAKYIAAGSGQLIKGILWCGDVTVERLKRGNDILKDRTQLSTRDAEVSPETLKRIRRAKRVTKITEKVAGGVLTGVVKVSGLFSNKLVNSRLGKKVFGLLPGEIVLASLDGFSKICDATEVAGKNVMSTSNTVTTEFVTHKYGEEAGKATGEGLEAAGHAIGTAWAVFKLRKALNPKASMKPTSLAKAAVHEMKRNVTNKK
ncbi:protein EARLY-RESPONSIVE TO DEHYDRATION 7, chloroplastic-like [Impatiens glandulifera]|uniref:protein EARLY-RESPONSIVE TO DEHYDRATION 7, chloroplastic-like n=1 Tax=Impatiens glandulifera TaxID=253017 RepID=UPI001FB0C982|nr:protein EARLY-RESPONSIVE TO DEHYDRATION 7, chloroplastic-like [Impatiens glandulifera]